MTGRHAPVRTAAVLGAGTMGAQLAALFANIGVPVLLLISPRTWPAKASSGRAG